MTGWSAGVGLAEEARAVVVPAACGTPVGRGVYNRVAMKRANRSEVNGPPLSVTSTIGWISPVALSVTACSRPRRHRIRAK